jgi:hypothetical protein
MFFRSFAVLSVVVLTACSGQALDVGDTSAPSDSGAGLAQAACTNPTHGPAASYGTPAELTALLARKWFTCDHGTPSFFQGANATDGIEFAADGHWYRLSKNASGSVERLNGLDNEGTWRVFRQDGTFFTPADTTPGVYPYVYVEGSSSELPTAMGFEENPSRLRTEEATSGVRTWLVPVE